MIAALICAGALLAPAPQEPPRMRTILPNGAVVLAERVPDSDTCVVTLVASTRGIPEGRAAHGRRHLLEHLLAKGNEGLDVRLETQGLFLTASTGRDTMEFTVRGPVGSLDVALSALAEVIAPRKFGAGAIRKEAEIVGEELALAAPEAKLLAAAWTQAYDDLGLNALGSLDALRTTQPADLEATYRELFGSDQLALVVASPASPASVLPKLQRWMAPRAKAPSLKAPIRESGKPGRAEVVGVVGEARSAIVPGVISPRSVWALAAAFAIAGGFDDAFLVYTPSAGDGLVTVGRTGSNSGLGIALDAMQPAEIDALYPLGRMLAGLWIDGHLSDAEAIALSRAQLLAQAASLRPETLRENLDAMTLENFREGMAMFGRERCVVTVGVGR